MVLVTPIETEVSSHCWKGMWKEAGGIEGRERRFVNESGSLHGYFFVAEREESE